MICLCYHHNSNNRLGIPVGEIQQLNPVLQRRVQHIVNKVRGSSDLDGAIKQAVADLVKPEGKKDPHQSPEGVIKTPEHFDDSYHASTVILCKDIADILVKKYPGYLWAVQPDERGQMINIYNHNLHNQYGYRIRMKEIMDDPTRRLALIAGGEILERFKQPHTMDPEALRDMPRDLAGNGIPDLTGVATKQQKHRAAIAKALADGRMQIVEGPDGQRYARMVNP